MQTEIKEIKEKKVWQNFVDKLFLNTFLHSKNWGDFNEKQGHKVFYFGLYNDNQLSSVALIIRIQAKRGSFLLIPHGPQTDLQILTEGFALSEWTKFFQVFAQSQKCSFVRVQPILPYTSINQSLFITSGYREAPIHTHTELSTVLNLQKSEKEILLGMRKTTRQMIKKGLKMLETKEVVVEFPTEISPAMMRIYKSTTKRGHFTPYSERFLKEEWETFAKTGDAKLITVSYENKILSWGMVLISGNRAFYHQGANILNKKIPSSYLCQWHGIKFALEKECITYDFWGVAPENQPNHPWANISLFKRGFGGKDVQLVHAKDLIINWTYWLTWLIEIYRARKRGF